ncbi:NADH-quinone oxidoreductase subunit L [Candidatus Omnitrophota bacterium]
MKEYFTFDNLSNFVALFVVFFSVIVTVYSFGFMKGRKGLLRYYLYILLTLVASLGVVFANHLVVLIIFWGFLGFLLYLLIGFGESERTSYTAKKTFIIIGGTDAIMLLGLALIWHLTGTFKMGEFSIPLNSKVAIVAYISLAIGAFAKAGAMPFHTWVPDTAEDAPTPVTAFLPASLDKLLGIYFLARISLNLFQMSPAMNTFLMIVGSFTIVAAVMMALIQHDFKRLLGYHAVSQVGYMVLGIGTGNPIGIAGGMFHMLNHAIYKSCLFLSSGSVEKETGTTKLDKLGGLATAMPITFFSFLVASFAISGVPPFNGFASKWMVYQGIIQTASTNKYLWIVWLIAAMFGSALTLASFMKLIHAIFLGQKSDIKKKYKETSPLMWIPTGILALLCIVFGVFAYRIPLKYFILPSFDFQVSFSGMWNSSLATALLIVGVLIGTVIYLLGTILKVRETETFIGGEAIQDNPEVRVSGTEFYNTVQDIKVLKVIYALARKKLFDPYEVGTKLTFGFNALLRYIHNGVLSTYLAWCLLGMIILFYIILR